MCTLTTYSEIYRADDSDGKVHSFRTKNLKNASCQLLKLLKIIKVILPFIKKVLKLEPCSIPRTFGRHGPTAKITGEIAKHTGTKSPGSLPGLLSSKFVSVCNNYNSAGFFFSSCFQNKNRQEISERNFNCGACNIWKELF